MLASECCVLKWSYAISAQDGQWSQWHYTFAGLSPIPIALLLLTAIKGWEGFAIFVGSIPLVVVLAIVGKPLG